jgi:hypothetical protein
MPPAQPKANATAGSGSPWAATPAGRAYFVTVTTAETPALPAAS